MTTTRKTLGLALGVALLAGGGIATAHARDGADVSPSVSAASADLATVLQLAREEERLARELYKVLADTYNGAVPFSRITLSEQRHYEAIGVLLQRHHVTDPSVGKAAGTYADPTLQTNYNTWLAQGTVSLDKAYEVGVAVEKADIADLTSSINTVTDADVRQVLTHLLNCLAAPPHRLPGSGQRQPGRARPRNATADEAGRQRRQRSRQPAPPDGQRARCGHGQPRSRSRSRDGLGPAVERLPAHGHRHHVNRRLDAQAMPNPFHTPLGRRPAFRRTRGETKESS